MSDLDHNVYVTVLTGYVCVHVCVCIQSYSLMIIYELHSKHFNTI